MSNTRGDGDDGSAVPVGVAIAEPTVPLSEDATWEVMVDVAETLAAAGSVVADEDATLVRDARAAEAAGDRRRADALECARALSFERQGRTDDALASWRTAFDHDPSLLIAYWGLRRTLEARGAWDELLGVLERRIGALAPIDSTRGAPFMASPGRTVTAENGRADLWLGHGRVLEDRLELDEAAARSYRTGLIEAPGHEGLLFSLALLGWRRADNSMIAEALTGFLRLPLPPAARAGMTAAVARIERSASSAKGSGGVPVGAIDAVSAARALDTLRGALGAVRLEDAAPLLSELWILARATVDPLARVEILQELVNHLPAEPSDVVVGLLRERARLQRDQLGDKAASAETFRRALALQPRHPLLLTELADLVEEAGRDGGSDGMARTAEGLATLLATIAPPGQALDSAAEQELAHRYLVALGRQGRAAEGLAFLERHPEIRGSGPDAEMIEVALRSMAGDRLGLIARFDATAADETENAAAGTGDGARLAANAHVIAGVLRELGAGDETVAGEALSSYRKALALDPTSEVAADAIQRRLLASRSWSALAEHWRGCLEAGGGGSSIDAATRARVLEELVVLERDELADPVAARRFQDELCALGDDPRAHLRRLDLELATGAGLTSAPTASMCESLRALGDLAGTSDAQAALHVEAGLALAARGARQAAEEILRATLSTDATGRAASGLEHLPEGAGAAEAAAFRAEVVRAELVRRGADDGPVARALRFRIAHHLASAGRASEAVEGLDALRSGGDALAAAFAWEIARRSEGADLASAVLEATLDAPAEDLRVASDLGEALEAAGDLPGAAAAFRDALRKQPTADAALGLLRIGALMGDAAVIVEAGRGLEPFADEETRLQVGRDVEMLDLLARPNASDRVGFELSVGAPASTGADDEDQAVLSWAAAMRRRDVVSTSAGLLALARLMRETADVPERNGLVERAAARARLGGAGLAGAVHEQAHSLSGGGAALAVGLSDLPVAGRPERASARLDRAARSGGRLGYALDIERATDADGSGDSAAALEAYRLAARRDPSGIEALDGIRRVCLATGNRLGAARAGMRLGAVLKDPRRAAVEFRRAAAMWQEEGMRAEAKIAAWQALAHDASSEAVFEFLRDVLVEDADHAGLDRLLGLRLSVVDDEAARVPLLLDRAANRLDRLGQRDLAIQDFKRILKIFPDHRGALRALATLAISSSAPTPAIAFLKRLAALESDAVRRRDLVFELAEAHEAAGDGGRALALLEQAVAAQPDDEIPRGRLVDHLLRVGKWRAARAALETRSSAVVGPGAAAIWIRIGAIERDHGRDRQAASAAFVKAATLDPLGDGVFHLAELHRRFNDGAARRAILDDAVVEVRRALARTPFDIPRLRRLRALYLARADVGALDDDAGGLAKLGVSVVGQVLALFGAVDDVRSGGGQTPRFPTLGGEVGPTLSTHLRAPGAGGFAAEIWTKIARAATEMFDATNVKPPARERVSPGAEPRLAWIEGAAAALGLPGLELLLSKRQGTWDDSVVAIDATEPALALGRAALTGDAKIRFRVGRALALLRDRAVMFEDRTAAEMATLFAAATSGPGAGTAAAVGESDGPADVAGYRKNMLRLMSRKDRKALESEVSRFGFETIDAAAFQRAVLETADRFGLLLAGDVEAAVRVVCADRAVSPEEVVADGRAAALLRFALGEEYLMVRRDVGEGGE